MPAASVLCTMSGETILSTTWSPGKRASASSEIMSSVRQKHVVRRRDRADELDDLNRPRARRAAGRPSSCTSASVRSTACASAPDSRSSKATTSNTGASGALGRGQMLGVERVDPVPDRHRVAAAAQAVEVRLRRIPAEPERALVRLDHLRALPREHLRDRVLELARLEIEEQRRRAEHGDVRRAARSGGARDPLGVDQHVPRQRGQPLEHRLDRRVVADVHERVDARRPPRRRSSGSACSAGTPAARPR